MNRKRSYGIAFSGQHPYLGGYNYTKNAAWQPQNMQIIPRKMWGKDPIQTVAVVTNRDRKENYLRARKA